MKFAVGNKDTTWGEYDPPASLISCKIYFYAIPVSYLIKLHIIEWNYILKQKKKWWKMIIKGK